MRAPRPLPRRSRSTNLDGVHIQEPHWASGTARGNGTGPSRKVRRLIGILCGALRLGRKGHE